MNLEVKRARAASVNALIQVIGSYGHRFFYYAKSNRFATMSVRENGHIYSRDHYTGGDIYTHFEGGRWRAFSGGGTLRALVIAFRKFIATGEPVPARHFGPWPDWICDGDLWGYGESMEFVRDAAFTLGVAGPRTNDRGGVAPSTVPRSGRPALP